MPIAAPTRKQLITARKRFEINEPRDLFYRAATELVDLAIRNKIKLSVAESLAVLLQTWNQQYYRFHPFTLQHFSEIDGLVQAHEALLKDYRARQIESYNESDNNSISTLFESFERILGPVGAAKCLHLLAPEFFPLWDRAIAKAYGLPFRSGGENGTTYTNFMVISKKQCLRLRGQNRLGRNLLKAIDEFNYCRYTKSWI